MGRKIEHEEDRVPFAGDESQAKGAFDPESMGAGGTGKRVLLNNPERIRVDFSETVRVWTVEKIRFETGS